MSTLERAVEIAAVAHAGIKDKQGEPYLLHPLRVMMGVEGEHSQAVAVLHDVVEDTDATLESIAAEGFATEVIEALDLVTHRDGVPYSDYVVACKRNPIARAVKLSDLRDNTQLARALMRPRSQRRDAERIQRYLLSYQFLEDKLTEAAYREAMAALSS